MQINFYKKKIFIFTVIFITIILFNYFLNNKSLFLTNDFNFFNLNYFLNLYTVPLQYFLGISLIFFIEYKILGWDNSSLKSILNISNPTCRVDIFYIWLKLSGLSNIIFNIIFFGFGFYFLKTINELSIIKINNLYLEFLVAILTITFIDYIYHRICHHRLFWEFHKIHHAAEEMNILTVAREHPLVVSVRILLISLPIGIFGISAEIAVICQALLGGYNLMLHSKVFLLPKFFNFFLITTKDHHLHHSTNEIHFNKNFGNLFNFWDKLFGTYYNSKLVRKISIGVKDKNYNNKNFIQQILIAFIFWFKNLKKTYISQ